MAHLKLSSILALLSCLIAVHIQASVIALDSFDTNGSLLGQDGGTGFTDAWEGGSYTVSSGLVSGTGNAYRTLETPFGASGEVWVSFNMVRNSGQGYGGISFFEGTAERLIIGDWFEQGNWSIDAKMGTADARQTSDISLDQNRTVVIKLTLGSGASSSVDLWIGADATSDVDVSRAPDLSFSGADLEGINKIRIGSDFDQSVDSLVLGTSFSDVRDVAWIPEPDTYALLTGVLALGLALVCRRTV